MKASKATPTLAAILAIAALFCAGCQHRQNRPDNADQDKASLLAAMDSFETAWANGDFLKVDSFFTDNARRLHTEPYVWNRKDITEFCRKKAAETAADPKPAPNNNWRKSRKYLDIRADGNIGYDVFTTEQFKALHIWEKQKDGSWKILFDMGFLNQTSQAENPALKH